VVKHLACHSKDVGSSSVGASGTVSEKIAKKEEVPIFMKQYLFCVLKEKSDFTFLNKFFFPDKKKKRLATFSIF